ncbi:MAG TPA: hypothetical protein VK157_10575 [Phycisphaerales bacterium]|nr:hypothetical protein [Phycisphaerales bacterium]
MRDQDALSHDPIDLPDGFVVDGTSKGVTLQHPPFAIKPIVRPEGLTFAQRGDGMSTRWFLVAIGISCIGVGALVVYGWGLESAAFLFLSVLIWILATLRHTQRLSVDLDLASGTATYFSREFGFPIRYMLPLTQTQIFVCQVDVLSSHKNWNDGHGVVIQVGRHGHMLAICLDRDLKVIENYLHDLPTDVKRLLSTTKLHVIARV